MELLLLVGLYFLIKKTWSLYKVNLGINLVLTAILLALIIRFILVEWSYVVV